jgi:uncharacterized delta-60 repeat protein
VPVPGPERNDVALVRFNVDGSLDRSFGTDGRVNEPQGSFGNPGSGYERIGKIVLQPDGKIVAAGSANGSFVLVRYKSDGSLDHTFGSGGVVATPFGGAYARAIGLVRQPDGKLVAAGEALGTFEGRIAVARYMADGSLDSSFGSGGTLTTALGTQSGASSVVVQRDGKIVIGGWFGSPDSSGFALVRYTPTGLLDRTFSHGGSVVTDFGKLVPNGRGYPASVASLSLQADGKIVAVGTEEEPGSTGPIFKVALARYYPDGAPDEPFLRTLALGPAQSTASDAALQPDGKIVLAGGTGRSDGKEGAVFALARVLARPTFCVVPNVKGSRLAAAKQRISRRHCSVGKVSRVASRKVPRGRVIGEKPHPGMRLDVQAKVALVLSNGVPRSK